MNGKTHSQVLEIWNEHIKLVDRTEQRCHLEMTSKANTTKWKTEFKSRALCCSLCKNALQSLAEGDTLISANLIFHN